MRNALSRILIIGHSNIGDVCCDLIVVNPLRSRFRQANISFLTSPRANNIAEGYKGLDRVLTFDKYAQNSGLFARLRLMKFLAREKFDLAVVLKSTLMHNFLGIPIVWNLRKYLGTAPSEKHMHPIDIYLGFLRSHDIDTREAVFEFGLGQKEREFCDTFFTREKIGTKDRLIGILPMAAWPLKNWPIDRWNKLAELLYDQCGIKVIAFGKFANDSYSRIILSNISHRIILAKNTTLKQAMGLIKRCHLFIGPDSSLVHLASCLRVNTIGLYGATSSSYIYPYFHRHNVINSKAKMDCMPCYPGGNPCQMKVKFQTGACMEGISVEEVLELVKHNLAL